MKNHVLASIIVPCYNVSDYLVECLDSIKEQTIKNIEIICINDGSTDRTGNLLDSYICNDPGKFVLLNQVNRGLSEARNAGLRVAKGKYVMFIDSDDYIESDTIEKGLKAFSSHDIDCVNFGMKAFVDKDELDLKKVEELNDWLSNKWHGEQYFDFSKAYKTNANVCNKMYRLSDIKGKYEFLPGLYYEDIYFSWIMFFHTKKMWYEDGIQYHYRIRSNSIMTDTQKEKNFEKAMHHFYNWDQLIRSLSYDEYLFTSNYENLLRLLKKYAWWVAYYSPEDKAKKIEEEHNRRIDWLTEIYYNHIHIKEWRNNG